ncbi:TIM barrel protein [Asaia krungthepensis]|uniref:Hydroxypyruvate isomerase n=1 Tax=Asaia krungthepensis NRIC 0535 TaxID=1307925 RepID=A0ABQ0Q0S0_9PROT|nr:TIM barrel protein [Asaia krungthepensis]GBQ86343.1 hydroxypyruvate isomerase [Asaia krungthepensis NRIC 0535]
MSSNTRLDPVPSFVHSTERYFALAVCAEMQFLDLPFIERVRHIAREGFMVEIWDWTRHDLKRLAATGAMFSSMTGYVRGTLADRDGASEMVRTAMQSIHAAKELGVPRLNLHGTGLGPDGLPVLPCMGPATGAMWMTARDTLCRLADLGAKHDVMFVLENLNAQVDHPGVPFGRAEDCLSLVQSVDHPALRLMLDLYHAQIGEGNLIALIEKALPFIGEIQVADVPGRCEPGTGEINYRAVARALQRLDYRGVIGLESWAADGSSERALQRFAASFELDEIDP